MDYKKKIYQRFTGSIDMVEQDKFKLDIYSTLDTLTPSTGEISTAMIADDAVTFAKMQNIGTDTLIGRDTAATGSPEEITLNATLSMTGSNALQRAALTGDVTASAGSNATTIAAGSVTVAKTSFLTDWASDANISLISFGTVANSFIVSKRIGDTLYVRGKVEAGTVVGATASIRIAGSRTIDFTKLPSTANQHVGWVIRVFNAAGPTAHTTNASGQCVLFTDGSDTDDVFFSSTAGSDVFVKDQASAIYSNSDTVSFEFSVPITEWDS